MASETETTRILEAAFNEAAEWIKAGEVTGEFGGNPYRWRRGPWRFDQMSQSPSGRFSCINGPEFVAYLRPDARPASGFMGRVDLRAKATPELLLGLPQKLASESGENDTNPWAKPMEEWDIGDVERAIDMETTCTWAYDEDGVWNTSCSHSFSIFEGTPEQNGMGFCCYCGKRLQQKLKAEVIYGSPL